MPEPNGSQTAEEKAAAEAAAKDKSLLDGGDVTEDGQPKDKDTPETETAEAKAARETEEKRILEADEATLSEEDKTKRVTLVKAKEDKRLLETPDDKLSEEDKPKKAALIKAKEEAEKKAKAAKGAPEAYTDFKLPEGVEITDAMKPLIEDFKALAKKRNLTQEAAQEFVDLQTKHLQSIADGMLNIYNQTVTAWKKETKEALGPEYKKELAFGSKAIEKFGTPELRAILNQTGVGNHKELVNFFVKIGKAISEDTFVPGQQQATGKSDVQKFYGDSMGK